MEKQLPSSMVFRFVLNRNRQKIVVEIDCLPIFNFLSSESSSLSSFGAISDDCLGYRSSFQFLSFSFVRRSGNSTAHAIATAISLHCNEGSSLPSGSGDDRLIKALFAIKKTKSRIK